jgi:hypothetical protein
VFVIVINVAKMYRLNCVESAPQVRGCLSRDILTLRRAEELRARGIPAPVEFEQQYRRPWDRLSRWLWTPVGGHGGVRSKSKTGDSLPATE